MAKSHIGDMQSGSRRSGDTSRRDRRRVDWAVSDAPVDYLTALEIMSRRADAIRDQSASDLSWLLEHPPLYTAGSSAKPQDLLAPDLFPVYPAGRGGQYTYHGPGQRIVYLMLDLKERGGDVRALVDSLERWIIAALARFNVKGETRPGRVGIWVTRPTRHGVREDKIAAIGLRVTRWVTTHGVSLNVDPDLSHYRGIVPCGISDYGVTSLTDLGLPITMADADVALRASFEEIFGPVAFTAPPDTALFGTPSRSAPTGRFP
jgi:lipoyl(octanoyl) transferase